MWDILFLACLLTGLWLLFNLYIYSAYGKSLGYTLEEVIKINMGLGKFKD